MRVTKETVAQVGHILETNGIFDNESDGTIADFFRLIRENVAGMPRRFTIAKTIPQQLGSAVLQSAFDILGTLVRDEPYWDMAEFEKIFNEKIKEDIKLKEIIKEAGFPFIYGKDITYQSIRNLEFFYPMEEKKPAAKVTVNEKGWITADHALTEIRKIPLDYPGGIDAFIEKEIMPHTPDAWVNRNTAIIGYKIDFVKQFYKTQLQEMAEIVADIRHMSIKTQGEGNNT
jgi:type I restriction enzyme M protein